MRVKVSRNLELYRPLTIWQIIRKIVRQLLTFLFFAVSATAVILLTIGCFIGGPSWVAVALTCTAGGSVVLGAIFLYRKQPLNNAIKEFWQRNIDRYVTIFVRDESGDMRFRNAVVWSAIDYELKMLRDQEGFHAILPLFSGVTGWLLIGRNGTEGKREYYRSLWAVHPVYLDADDHPGLTTVTVNNWNDRNGDSMTLPLSAVAALLLAAPIRNDANSSVSMTVSGMAARCEKYADELADCRGKLAQAKLLSQRAIDALHATHAELEASKRFVRSKEGARIREVAGRRLLELLPADDPRRSLLPQDQPAMAS